MRWTLRAFAHQLKHLESLVSLIFFQFHILILFNQQKFRLVYLQVARDNLSANILMLLFLLRVDPSLVAYGLKAPAARDLLVLPSSLFVDPLLVDLVFAGIEEKEVIFRNIRKSSLQVLGLYQFLQVIRYDLLVFFFFFTIMHLLLEHLRVLILLSLVRWLDRILKLNYFRI